MANAPARYWLLTVPEDDWTPIGPQTQAFSDKFAYVRGQLEVGAANGFRHWQLLVVGRKPIRLNAVKTLFGGRAHCEKSRSAAADDYVWKEDTRVADTQFELGERPFKRNSSTDWDSVKQSAKSGRLDDIPADIYVRLYGSLKRIAKVFVCLHLRY
jgi:hypothetical protein